MKSSKIRRLETTIQNRSSQTPLAGVVALLRGTLALVGIAGIIACGVEAPDSSASGAGPAVDPDHPPQSIQLPLNEAPCTVEVDGFGDVDIEDDYIPNVVACENGAAPMEALKAQAVQARGYIYYKLLVAGEDSVVNGTDDQVYDCDYADANDDHVQAAEATRGQYLSWNDHIIAPFYVAGAIPDDSGTQPAEEACVGSGGTDPTETESWVTYNLGLTGCDIEMTPLGWRPDDCQDNPYNRGCASQNGQSCLAERGWNYDEMFPYYYGDDVELDTAGGTCGGDGAIDEYDQHCQGSADGWSCFDNQQRIRCDDGLADVVEECDTECEAGQCDTSFPGDEFCGDDADGDGWWCVDDELRIECRDQKMAATERCSDGCEDDRCIQSDGSGEADERTSDSDEPGPGVHLVTESQGIDGGCSTTAPVPLTPWTAVALLIAAAGWRQRWRVADYFVP